MLWTSLAIVFVLWGLGWIAGIGDSLIHLLSLVAGALLILQLITGRRTRCLTRAAATASATEQIRNE